MLSADCVGMLADLLWYICRKLHYVILQLICLIEEIVITVFDLITAPCA